MHRRRHIPSNTPVTTLYKTQSGLSTLLCDWQAYCFDLVPFCCCPDMEEDWFFFWGGWVDYYWSGQRVSAHWAHNEIIWNYSQWSGSLIVRATLSSVTVLLRWEDVTTNKLSVYLRHHSLASNCIFFFIGVSAPRKFGSLSFSIFPLTCPSVGRVHVEWEWPQDLPQIDGRLKLTEDIFFLFCRCFGTSEGSENVDSVPPTDDQEICIIWLAAPSDGWCVLDHFLTRVSKPLSSIIDSWFKI